MSCINLIFRLRLPSCALAGAVFGEECLVGEVGVFSESGWVQVQALLLVRCYVSHEHAQSFTGLCH